MKFLTILTVFTASVAAAQHSHSRRSTRKHRHRRQCGAGGAAPSVIPDVPAVETTPAPVFETPAPEPETGNGNGGNGGGNNNNGGGNNGGNAGNGGNNGGNGGNPGNGGNGNGNAGGNNGGNGGNAGNGAANGQTLVLFEVGGVPGNECLTFRNNGEIVNAACVNEAADRQLTPSTINGADVLVVQRSFSNGFRPDLVGQQVCVGFNGTHFKAEDCASDAVELVSFTGTNVVAPGGACLNGHDDRAQVTVDPNGQGCAEFTPTNVTPTPP